MLTKSKMLLSLALVLGTASAATAATKHPIHHRRKAVEQHAPAAAYQIYGSLRRVPSEPAYLGFQDYRFDEGYGF